MSMRPRSSTWEWGAFADAMRYAKGSCDSWAAKRLFAATRASFGRWLCRDRVAHVSIVTANRSVTVHGAGDQMAPQLVGRNLFRSPVPHASARGSKAKPVRLLSGGNLYIAAMPGWKRDLGRRLDALIVRTVPGVRKAVRWNSPFYGVEGQGSPPGESKHKHVRYVDILEDELDEAQMATWVRQAASLPGWAP
jgi:hypothetical protein